MSDSAYAIDVGRDNFDAVVLQGSAATPVLVDFWAPWCAPCRALAPILDKLAAEMAGRFVLAKLNTDLYPDIAGRYGIRGIPDVKVFVAGEVVDAFTGVLPERELRAFLERVIPSSVAPLVARARAVRETGDAGQALALLADAAAVDAGDEALVFEQAETLLALDRAQDAAAALAALEAPDRVRARPVRDRSRLEALQARTTLRAHARADAAALAAAAARVPVDCAAKLAYADALAAGGDYDTALRELLAIVATNRGFGDDVGRTRMLTIFAALGGDSDLVRRYRRELAAVINR
ncbi:MAG: tetratricopeptide repeat protein [Betaproteobacteria bacterium]|jgi:putative thioredoxin|nr:tetratricopeptide repeat protein [Betaproteobacteria bacterium]MBK7079559.1 tetratricopeptide repeat protein [Betaproteobacteria bacterium]MBK7743030.1 tetratricopeptide repeat protein [Betaproteobacteria bacterium]MBK8688212.1 tetratricopeptide repeat protein [Betaproteobacteria bacterium]MBK9676893.1 tetratricopeptide repeat protein [Betaproteobacteria bacterium]